MSAHNGDRSRFGRVRKQKVLRRANNVKLRKELAAKRTQETGAKQLPAKSQ